MTLVDEANVSVLGRTPIDASIDASRSYEVVFALDAHVTQVAHLDPTKTLSVAVTLDSPKPAKPAHRTRHRSSRH